VRRLAEKSIRLSAAHHNALQALRERFGTMGASTKQWETVCTAVMSRSTFFRAKKELVKHGYVRVVGRRFQPVERVGHGVSQQGVTSESGECARVSS
jgi:hypothetical protein